MKTSLHLALLLALAPAPVLAQQKFDTPEAAVAQLVKLAGTQDEAALGKLLGPEYSAFRKGQDADKALADARRKAFVSELKEFRTLSAEGDDRRILYVGSDAWPFPAPIVRSGGKWMFDGKAGVEELENRIIGANELNAIAALDAYSVAQRVYSLEDHDGDGVLEYAQRFASTAGKHDGLYWETD